MKNIEVSGKFWLTLHVELRLNQVKRRRGNLLWFGSMLIDQLRSVPYT